MTAARAVVSRARIPRAPKLTIGYVQVPRSLVENQALLTPAELRFALIVLRRPDQTVSDQNWANWTGLDPRSKENAIRGLRSKCLTIDGRGDKAKYRFDRGQWPKFVTEASHAALKPRTAGRGVDAKKGTKVHPQCRENGCAMLNAEQRQSELSLVPPSPNAKPVSQSEGAHESGAGLSASPASGLVKLSTQTDKSSLLASENAKRVSRNSGRDPVELIWAKALAALQAIFPLCGVAFLVRLVSVVTALFANVSDSELAKAIEFAWAHKSRYQKGEGLFLFTVPTAITALRKLPESPPVNTGPDLLAGVRMLLGRVWEGLEARGAPFAEIAAAVSDLHGRVKELGDIGAIDKEMQELEGRILQVACTPGVLSEAESGAVADCVESRIRPYLGGRMQKLQLDNLREQLRGQETLAVLMLPRLSSLSV